MRLPILYALTEGTHVECNAAPWSPISAPALHFEAPDPRRYPCLELAREAARTGGSAPIVLNAANEEAVAALLDTRLRFLGIPRVIEEALSGTSLEAASSVEEALEIDRDTRIRVRETILTQSAS
jgi:1-deoxy-D-xylulose-5-phosphate reductoisomerase